MTGQPYRYAAEKFDAARHALMLPHPRGEAESIAGALFECEIGLHDVKPEHLDESATHLIRDLRALMDTKGIVDPGGRGTMRIKAEQFTVEEKFKLSSVVDELAHWFHSRAEEVR